MRMLLLLAATLGLTADEVGARMSAPEFRLWCGLYRACPWGEDRADVRSGVVAATFANVMRGKGQRARSPLDFMPFARAERRAQTDEEIERRLAACAVVCDDGP